MKCPNCQFINEIDTDLKFERARGITNQTVDKWDNGTYYCLECGSTGPKNMIERLAAIFELLFRNKLPLYMLSDNKVIEFKKECWYCKRGFPLNYYDGYGWFHYCPNGGPDLRCEDEEVQKRPDPDEAEDLILDAAKAKELFDVDNLDLESFAYKYNKLENKDV